MRRFEGRGTDSLERERMMREAERKMKQAGMRGRSWPREWVSIG